MVKRCILPPAPLMVLCLAALAAGCAHPIPNYVPVSTGPSALLVMRGSMLPGETYGVYLFKQPQRCTGLEQVGVGNTNADPATTQIAANRLSTAEVFVTKPNGSFCRVRWSFEPVAGRKYLVAASSTPHGCRAQILDATDPHKIVAEPSSRRRDVGGSACLPLAQTTTFGDAESRARANGEADLPIPATPVPAAPGTAPTISDDDLSGLMGK